jgi:hypothetical protein
MATKRGRIDVSDLNENAAAQLTEGDLRKVTGGAIIVQQNDLIGRQILGRQPSLTGKEKEPGYFTISWEPET